MGTITVTLDKDKTLILYYRAEQVSPPSPPPSPPEKKLDIVSAFVVPTNFQRPCFTVKPHVTIKNLTDQGVTAEIIWNDLTRNMELKRRTDYVPPGGYLADEVEYKVPAGYDQLKVKADVYSEGVLQDSATLTIYVVRGAVPFLTDVKHPSSASPGSKLDVVYSFWNCGDTGKAAIIIEGVYDGNYARFAEKTYDVAHNQTVQDKETITMPQCKTLELRVHACTVNPDGSKTVIDSYKATIPAG